MSELLEVLREAKRAGDYQLLVKRIPYCEFLGLTARTEAERVIVKMAYDPSLIGNPTLPALHGGTIGALLESTAIFQLLYQAESVILPKTINITVQYLRPGKPVDTYASAEIQKLGRRVASVRALAWQSEPAEPIASAIAHLLIKPAEPADP